MTAIPAHRHLLVRLQQEWEHLARSPQALARARRWPLGIDRIRSLDDVLRHTGYGFRVPAGCSAVDNRALATLVSVAADDDLAARVVLQRLLPGLSALARRYAHTIEESLDTLDEAISAAWVVIRDRHGEWRPGFVASALLRDIEYVAFRRPTRRKAQTMPMPRAVFELIPVPEGPQSAAEELDELLDDASAAGLTPEDVDLARRLGTGGTVDQLAAERKVTSRTIRNHRKIVVYRLRRVARQCA